MLGSVPAAFHPTWPGMSLGQNPESLSVLEVREGLVIESVGTATLSSGSPLCLHCSCLLERGTCLRATFC